MTSSPELYLEIDPAAPAPIYEQIIDGIQRLVRERRLTPGSRLPSVRQLAADLEINANTVARAYGLMERDGLIDTARRRGTRVADAAPARAAQSLAARIEDVADRVIREAASLGIDPGELVRVLGRRLGDDRTSSSVSKGKRS